MIAMTGFQHVRDMSFTGSYDWDSRTLVAWPLKVLLPSLGTLFPRNYALVVGAKREYCAILPRFRAVLGVGQKTRDLPQRNICDSLMPRPEADTFLREKILET
jgi:hypothetical protein